MPSHPSTTFNLLDRLLDDLVTAPMNAPLPTESGDHYQVQLALPGVPPESIDLTVDGRTLTVTVDQRDADEREDGGYRTAMAGRRTYSWMLPDGIDPEGINATCEHGLLTITVPKAESAKARRIQIGGSTGARQVEPGSTKHSSAQGEVSPASATEVAGSTV